MKKLKIIAYLLYFNDKNDFSKFKLIPLTKLYVINNISIILINKTKELFKINFKEPNLFYNNKNCFVIVSNL